MIFFIPVKEGFITRCLKCFQSTKGSRLNLKLVFDQPYSTMISSKTFFICQGHKNNISLSL